MGDETNPDVSIENNLVNSSLNEDKPSSSSYEHIEESDQQIYSMEDNNNHSHIKPLQNGDSSTIQPEENHSDETQFIEETSQIHQDDHQQAQFSSHIEPSNTSYEQIQQSSNDQDSFQITQNSFEQLNSDDNQTDSNSFLVDDDTNFITPPVLHDKPDELKPQRELDEDEIPPAELPVDKTPTHNQTDDSSTHLETNINDDRPLTDLETPYEHHHEDQTSTNIEITNSTDEPHTNFDDNRPLTDLETPYEHQTPNSSDEAHTHIDDNPSLIEVEAPYDHHHHQNEIHLADFLVNQALSNLGTPYEHLDEVNNLTLPDLVSETLEHNHDDIIVQPIELEKPTFEEASDKKENNTIEEILPPLPPTLIAFEEQINTDLNKEEQEPLSSNNKSIFSQPEDILGNKSLLKQTIVEGTINTRPTRSTMATVSYTLSLVDNSTLIERPIESVSNERFFLSECDIIPAIDICVQLMNRGERALVDSDIRHCYGENGCEEKQIPPISSTDSYRMKIDLELHDWKSPSDVQYLPVEERLYWGDKKRQMGNFHYRRQNYVTALQCYNGALRFLDTDNNSILASFDESQRSILNDRYIQVQNNVAQVNLLLDKYEDCLRAVDNVLKHDPKNVKALFRQGKAFYGLGKYDKAIQPLKLFVQIQRGNSTATLDRDKASEIITQCENKLANYQKNEKEIYRRMFQPPPPTTNSTVNQQQKAKNTNQTNGNWWPYIALGSAVLATIGFVTFIKYRKIS